MLGKNRNIRQTVSCHPLHRGDSTQARMEMHWVDGEILAVQRMPEELRSSGMDEAQASATVRAVAE